MTLQKQKQPCPQPRLSWSKVIRRDPWRKVIILRLAPRVRLALDISRCNLNKSMTRLANAFLISDCTLCRGGGCKKKPQWEILGFRYTFSEIQTFILVATCANGINIILISIDSILN